MDQIVAPPPAVAAFREIMPAATPPDPTVTTSSFSMKQIVVETVFTGVVPFRVTISVKGPVNVAV
jgi:hypothetical protein